MIHIIRRLPLALVACSTLAVAAPPAETDYGKVLRERVERAKKLDGDPAVSPQGKAWAWMAVVMASNVEENAGRGPRNRHERLSHWQDAIGQEHAMWRDWFAVTRNLADKDALAERVDRFLGDWASFAPKSAAIAEAMAIQKALKAKRDAASALADVRKTKLRGFVRIVPGVFMMGSPLNESFRYDDETEHEVELHWSFWLSQTEVTQREWLDLIGTKPSHFTAAGLDAPVDSVSFAEAAYFMNAMSRREGLEECYSLGSCEGTVGAGCKGQVDNGTCDSQYTCTIVRTAGTACGGYRMPTEAEWEYAARAGTTTPTPIGAPPDRLLFPALEAYAWFAPNSLAGYESGWKCNNKVDSVLGKWCGPQPVGKKKPNPWGLYDMAGNVFELTSDYALNDGYLLRTDRGPEINPTGPAATGWGNMARGGAWLTGAAEARSAYRLKLPRDKRHVLIGLRVARTIR